MRLNKLILPALLLAACSKSPKVDLTLNAAGVQAGSMQLSQSGQTVMDEPIRNGKTVIGRQMESPGYYMLQLINSDSPLGAKKQFEVYLENAEYTIETSADKLGEYPRISTSSKTQQQLSDYYQLAGEMARDKDLTIDSLTRYRNSAAGGRLSKTDRAALTKKLRAAQQERMAFDADILKAYVTKHPDNTIAAHLMTEQAYETNPTLYNDIYQKFSPEARNSPEGKEIGEKLGGLMKLFAGATAPEIAGNTADGKPFSKKDIARKVILVEFWSPGNGVSDMGHAKLQNGIILTPTDRSKFGIVSVAITDDKASWAKAVKSDGGAWLNVSDLKGDASANVSNWDIKRLPAYFLLDGNWKMIKPNVELIMVDTEVHEYLSRH